MSSTSKVSIGVSNKEYTHKLNRDCNTTMSFGCFQPVFHQAVYGKSQINVQYSNLVRLAPMVSPSFARMYLQTVFGYVSKADVCPYYEAMRAETYYQGSVSYKPTKEMCISNKALLYILLVNYCKGVVVSGSYSGTLTVNELLTYKFTGSVGSYTPPSDKDFTSVDTSIEITTNNADFLFYLSDSSGNGALFGFYLSNAGKRLFNVLNGLGYSLNYNDDLVSMLPLLALYKMYFDKYNPYLGSNLSWSDTNAYKVINYCSFYGLYDFSLGTVVTKSGGSYYANVWPAIQLLLVDLSNLWYTIPTDFMSAVTQTPYVGSTSNAPDVNDGSNKSLTSVSTSNVAPSIRPQANAILTSPLLKSLERVTSFLAKRSVIGAKVSTLLSTLFGSDVVNNVFKDSNIIDIDRLDVNIDDVMSTSETKTSDSGDYLGAYAGKGIGFKKNSFKYSTNADGYVFGIACIVPESGYFQGDDLTLYAIDNNTLPNPMYDGLGFELIPNSGVQSDNYIYGYDELNPQTLCTGSFGYMPRYSGLKVAKNIVNGSMIRRSKIDSFCSYWFDHFITRNIIYQRADQSAPDFYFGDLLDPGTFWRYVARYNQLGQFNRIFYNSGQIFNGSAVEDKNFYYGEQDDEDNFLVQYNFNCSVRNGLKPISDSYDTIVDELHEKRITVKNM